MPFLILQEEIDLLPCEARVAPYLAPSEDGRALCCAAAEDPFPLLPDGGELPEDSFPYGRSGRCPYTIYSPLSASLRAAESVRRCYRAALQLVAERGLTSVAFPLIGDGRGGDYLHIAAGELGGFAQGHPDVTLLLAVRERESAWPEPTLLAGVEAYIRELRQIEQRLQASHAMLEDASTGSFPVITDEQIPAAPDKTSAHLPEAPQSLPARPRRSAFSRRRPGAAAEPPKPDKQPEGLLFSLSSFNPERDVVLEESFSRMVLRKIDEKGFRKDSDCYAKANIDRRVFSRLRRDDNYHPKKTTAVALAVALELPLNEANELLRKAGYSLSHSILFDVIVEYCILHKNYNIVEINELLFHYNLPLLGE